MILIDGKIVGFVRRSTYIFYTEGRKEIYFHSLYRENILEYNGISQAALSRLFHDNSKCKT